MQYKNAKNPANAAFAEQYMVELLRVEDAEYGDIVKAQDQLAYVLEHHAQKIYQVATGPQAGRWTTKYYNEDGDRKKAIFTNKKDLIQFLYKHYQKGDVRNKTYETVFNEMLTYKREMSGRSYKTIQDYTGYYKKYMTPLGSRKIADINEDDLREWIMQTVLPLRPTARAFRRLLIDVNVVFKYAIKIHCINENPMVGIGFDDYSKHCEHVYVKEEDKYFTEDEFEIIRLHMLQHSDEPCALVALLSMELGTRAGEIVALYNDDVDNNYINIHRQQIRNTETKPETFEIVDYTKDARCAEIKVRTHKITPRIREILDLAKQQPGESEFLFHNAKGKMITTSTYLQFLHRHLDRLGISKTGNHKFRNTYNNQLTELGCDVRVRAGQMGHTVRTNNQVYTHNRTDRADEVGNMIAAKQAKQDSLVKVI